MKIYIPKNFAPFELVSESMYDKFEHNPDLIYRLFDPKVLKWAQWMRDRYGPFIINDWYHGGPCQWRGLRTPEARKYYSPTSMHSTGQALDLFPAGNLTAREIIDDLKKVIVTVPHVTRIEDYEEITWVHGDTKPTGKGSTHFFLP